MVKKIYEHYKGGHYVVLGYGRHTETEEELVIYRSINDFTIWCCPYDMFFGQIEDGRNRFKLLGDLI